MDCNAYEKLIKAWLDGELTPPQKEQVGRHIASCDACGSTAADYQEIAKAVRAFGKERAPLPSVSVLEAKARAMAREEWIMVRSLQRVAALAAAVFLVALGTLFWSSSTHRQIDPTQVASREGVIDILFSNSDWEED